jgi:hypothetical protein
MTNIINEQQNEYKELLNEIETLKKQLENKEDDFKLRIWNAIDNVKENESPEIAGTLMTLEQHFWPRDDWVKIQKENGVEKVIFGNNFTLENVVKGFSEWTLLNCDSYSYIYQKNEKLEEKNALLEKKVAELTPFKEQVENLKENMAKTLNTYLKEEQQEEKNDWDYWHKEDLKELINENEDKPVEVAIEVIEKWEKDAKDFSEVLDTAEEWKNWQKGLLNDEIKEKSLMLQKSDKMLEEEITKNAKLQEELAQKLEMLRKNDQRFEDEAKEREELKTQLYLERKPLPSLPKEVESRTLNKQSIFKQLKTKTKAKVQQLQKLIKREKFHSQAIVVKIEVLVK